NRVYSSHSASPTNQYRAEHLEGRVLGVHGIRDAVLRVADLGIHGVQGLERGRTVPGRRVRHRADVDIDVRPADVIARGGAGTGLPPGGKTNARTVLDDDDHRARRDVPRIPGVRV